MIGLGRRVDPETYGRDQQAERHRAGQRAVSLLAQHLALVVGASRSLRPGGWSRGPRRSRPRWRRGAASFAPQWSLPEQGAFLTRNRPFFLRAPRQTAARVVLNAPLRLYCDEPEHGAISQVLLVFWVRYHTDTLPGRYSKILLRGPPSLIGEPCRRIQYNYPTPSSPTPGSRPFGRGSPASSHSSLSR